MSKLYSGRSLYKKNTTDAYSRPDVYSSSSASTATTGGIDLRDWMDRILHGTSSCGRHGEFVHVWYGNRDDNGRPVRCSCYNQKTRDTSPACAYCGYGKYGLSTGISHTDKWERAYKNFVGAEGGLTQKDRFSPPGLLNADGVVFYMRWDVNITRLDRIVEVWADPDGNPLIGDDTYPRFKTIYKPQTIYDVRGENGRLEFWQIYCLERDAVRPDVNFGGLEGS